MIRHGDVQTLIFDALQGIQKRSKTNEKQLFWSTVHDHPNDPKSMNMYLKQMKINEIHDFHDFFGPTVPNENITNLKPEKPSSDQAWWARNPLSSPQEL